MQRLKLLKPKSIMVPVDSPIKGTDYRVDSDETLDTVLSLLLENSTEYVIVENKYKIDTFKIY
ncbi:hypothetical protein [Clostridium tyrobutyricum]|uniref:hypothetical protein n=1 Tax=Clostridium tyrobutyricum TaxID=1519 RepID=UPI00073D4145|nr:hypothetical protein [Clostridium tyrobutyricum]